MFGTTLLVDVPLEDRESANHMKKLCTAVSIEAPDLFRIHGVPCIDRGPDRLRPPVVYEHWNGSRDSSSSKKHDNGGGGEDCVLKKTANFARPSSVSADTPNFFKVPGVAINSSSAITGVDAVCSPPPRHQPFGLPETYMHGRETKAVVGPKTIPGRWRETDRQMGQWGHATREFHHALLKMRHERGSQAPLKKDTSIEPASHPRMTRETRSTSSELQPDGTVKTTATAAANSGRQHKTTCSPTGGAGESDGRSARANRRKREDNSTPDPGVRKGSQPKTAVEEFMSRLEGERGPQNRRESIAAFKQMLRGCSTNNSARFEDATTGATASRHGGSSRVPDEEHVHGSKLRGVLARRQEAQRVVSGVMSTAEGSYMLSPAADASKICLGRVKSKKTPPSAGTARVAMTRVKT